MTYSDGSWKNKDGGEITGIVSLLYDIRFGGVFSLVKELENSKEFSFSNVIRGFLPYASMGDIIAPLLGYSKVGEGNEVRYYDKNGEKTFEKAYSVSQTETILSGLALTKYNLRK